MWIIDYGSYTGIEGKIFVIKIKLIHVWYVIRGMKHDNLPRKYSCECYVWMEGGDKSRQAHLLTFDNISGSIMRESGPGSFIEL